MWGRPNLHTSYRTETSIFPTWTQKILATIGITLMVLLPFNLPIVDQFTARAFGMAAARSSASSASTS